MVPAQPKVDPCGGALTIGGIIGKVVQVDQDQDTVILVVDESKNVRMRVTRQSVAAVLSGEEIPAKIKEEDTAR